MGEIWGSFKTVGTSGIEMGSDCPVWICHSSLTVLAGAVFVVSKESRLSSFVWFVCGSILGVVLWIALGVVDLLWLFMQLQRG